MLNLLALSISSIRVLSQGCNPAQPRSLLIPGHWARWLIWHCWRCRPPLCRGEYHTANDEPPHWHTWTSLLVAEACVRHLDNYYRQSWMTSTFAGHAFAVLGVKCEQLVSFFFSKLNFWRSNSFRLFLFFISHHSSLHSTHTAPLLFTVSVASSCRYAVSYWWHWQPPLGPQTTDLYLLKQCLSNSFGFRLR